MDQKVRETAQRRVGTASTARTVFLLGYGYSGGIDRPMTTIWIIPVGRCRFKESLRSESKRGSRLALVWRSLQSP